MQEKRQRNWWEELGLMDGRRQYVRVPVNKMVLTKKVG